MISDTESAVVGKDLIKRSKECKVDYRKLLWVNRNVELV